MATPVVMGEQLDPPKYGELWSEAASRVFLATYREYVQRVKFANAEGVVRRQLMGVSQLIPYMCNDASPSTITSDRY